MGWAVPGVERPKTPGQPHPDVVLLQEVVARCVARQVDGGLARGSLVDATALLQLAEAVQALALRELASVEATGAFRVADAQVGSHAHLSAPGWLHEVQQVDQGAGRARVRLAGRIATGGDLAPLGELLLAGRTTLAHVRAVAAGVRGLDPEIVAGSLDALCTLVQTTDPVTVARELRERAHAVSEDLARDSERRQRQRRGFRFARLTGGVGSGTLLLDGLSAAVVEEALIRTMTRQRAALDDAGEPDTRDALQRRADALVSLCSHALDCERFDAGDGSTGPLVGPCGVRAALTVVVHGERLTDGARHPHGPDGSQNPPGTDHPVGAEALGNHGLPPAARLVGADSGHPVLLSRSTLLLLACDADLSRVVLSGDSQVLDAGRTTRTVTPAQWRALVARDGSCVVTGCHRGPSQCRPTTSSTGPAAAPPTWTTTPCCATCTTPSSTARTTSGSATATAAGSPPTATYRPTRRHPSPRGAGSWSAGAVPVATGRSPLRRVRPCSPTCTAAPAGPACPTTSPRWSTRRPGMTYDQAPVAGPEDLDAAFAARPAPSPAGGTPPPSERVRLLLGRRPAGGAGREFVTAECRNTGKPRRVDARARCRTSSTSPVQRRRRPRARGPGRAGSTPAGTPRSVRREPLGVVAQITPWNYPLMMATWKWAPAVAAGNTVVLKTAETTPVTPLMLAELVAEVLPPGVLNVVCGDRDTGRGDGRAPGAGDGRAHRVGTRRSRGHGRGRRRPQAAAPRARRQGPGARASTTPTST